MPGLPVFQELGTWLRSYFSGRAPGPPPALNPPGTPFQTAVWALVSEIPLGCWTSYSALAAELAAARGAGPSSARAAGQAVGTNRISILIPCHRVLGKGGGLGGFGYGPDLKKALLELEGIPFLEP
jgi:methylated-DNA-[protein]-cysteine S-methyltransferase